MEGEKNHLGKNSTYEISGGQKEKKVGPVSVREFASHNLLGYGGFLRKALE